MAHTRTTYRRESQESAARVIAAFLAEGGRLDAREFDFLDGAGTLQILGIERERFMTMLSRSLGERLGSLAAGCSAGTEQFDAALDAIDDRPTQLIVAAVLLYLADVNGAQAGKREIVRRAWGHWKVTPQILEREMKIPLAYSHAIYGPAAVAA
jgi:hypothetical protein